MVTGRLRHPRVARHCPCSLDEAAAKQRIRCRDPGHHLSFTAARTATAQSRLFVWRTAFDCLLGTKVLHRSSLLARWHDRNPPAFLLGCIRCTRRREHSVPLHLRTGARLRPRSLQRPSRAAVGRPTAAWRRSSHRRGRPTAPLGVPPPVPPRSRSWSVRPHEQN